MSQAVHRLIDKRVVAEIEAGRGQAWAHTALRTKSPGLRAAMALGLSGGAMDEPALRDHVAYQGLSGIELAPSKRRTAAALATVWAAGGLGDVAMQAAHRVFRSILQREPELLTRDQQQIYAQLCFLLGQDEQVREAIETLPAIPGGVVETLLTDLVNPTRIGDHATAEWRTRLAAPFVREGLAPVTVDRTAQTLFDGLGAERGTTVDGPLVTVIMPCYQPDASLLTSIRSIVNQTYRNIEILLVDDASGAEYADVFDEAVASDRRIRYLSLETNGGTYRARNAALELAQGEFVTVQDADDWSHPERIHIQANSLLESPTASGSFSDAIRATDSLIHQWIGYSPRRRNASSLMFRRELLSQTGVFDSVRKSGDSEFYERLTRLAGPVVDTKTPLAITRLRSGTLSRADFSFQWMDPDRLLYRAAYRSWHGALGRAHARNSLPSTGTERPFPAPASMLRKTLSEEPSNDYDVVVVLDGSDPRAVDEAIELCSSHRLKTAALHMEDATRGRLRRPEIHEVLLEAQRCGTLDLLSPNDMATARVVVVITTGSIELSHSPEPRLLCDEVVAVARPPSSFRTIQDLSTVAESCHRLFGLRPHWAAATAEDRSIWGVDGWGLPLATDVIRNLSFHVGRRE